MEGFALELLQALLVWECLTFSFSLCIQIGRQISNLTDEVEEGSEEGASSASSVVTLCNSAIGAGVLSLPYAFRCAGTSPTDNCHPLGRIRPYCLICGSLA